MYPFGIEIRTLPFADLPDAEVTKLLKEFQIGLTVSEARRVQEMLGRPPTVVEAVIWGIQGSEHCSYKSSKRFLKMFTTSGKHVILGPCEDSGIVAITDGPPGKRWGIAVSHESHNHPSQIVPYEGAATGVGGCVRDVLCMGARVIGLLDPLRLGDLQSPESRGIATEVVRGIAGYGNAIGVPNLGGDLQFDAGYNTNCLVNVVAHGLVREDEIIHSYVPEEAAEAGYDIIIVGKPTDRSGFGGAAFASLSLNEEEKEQNTGAVQEPNPFLERHLLASSYALFDWLAANKRLLQVGFKDLGAGGVVCASVEQVADRGFGAEVDLEKVHVAIPDLPPEVIACAETQERFCWTCHPDLTEHILHHYNTDWDLPNIAENARASVIGKVTKEPVFRLHYKGAIVCEAKATDITCGLQYTRPTKEKTAPEYRKIGISEYPPVHDCFYKMISDPNVASASPVFRHYDKNVIGNTILEPGEGDAGVIAPLQDLQSYVHEGSHPDWENLPEEDRWTGVAVACDGNGRYGRHSPYWQGANAAVEAMRNVAAVGALPRALTDCLNYGNPEVPLQLWELEEGVRGIAEAAKGVAFDDEPVPVISGNVSLYNITPQGEIPPTAIVSCIGVMKDARKALGSQCRKSGSTILLVGERKRECGGSLLHHVLGLEGGSVPQPDFADVKKQILFVTEAIEKGLVLSCHDISDGGLLMALFEMLLPSKFRSDALGMMMTLPENRNDLSDIEYLFSETGGFLLEIEEKSFETVTARAAASGIDLFTLGTTTIQPILAIKDVCTINLPEAATHWKGALAKMLGL